jgi:uncharacterized protein Yka (UPF0111/DUF47 family)
MKSFLGHFIRLLLPKDDHFFRYLRDIARYVVEEAELLAFISPDNLPWEDSILKIQRLEHNADLAVEALQAALQKSFIAPLDHGEFEVLATALQRLAHRIGESALLLKIHAMKELPPGSQEIAEHILTAVKEVSSNIERMAARKDLDSIRASNREIRRLEVEVDVLAEQNIQHMHETIQLDPTNIIFVWRGEVFVRSLERILDACEEFAIACGTVLVRNM